MHRSSNSDRSFLLQDIQAITDELTKIANEAERIAALARKEIERTQQSRTSKYSDLQKVADNAEEAYNALRDLLVNLASICPKFADL